MANVNARHLLISNPPHGDVDAAEVASYFGLTAADVRMKANYDLPEIWFAEEDESRLSDTSEALAAAGLNTVLVAASDLVEVPDQSPAVSFAFGDEGLTVMCDDEELTLAYDAPVVVVACRPRDVGLVATAAVRPVVSQLSSWRRRGGARRSSHDDESEFTASPFLDFYTPSDDGVLRISLVQEVTTFPMLPANSPQGLSAIGNLVTQCEDRFEKCSIDHRLVDMTLRGIVQRVVTGSNSDGPVRSGFSYASEGLTQLLGNLSPDLKGIPQADLSSRLAYLTNRSRIA